MKNISFMGAVYSDVPAVTFPDAGGGVARFDDASITTATASDVASGKVFLASDGTITTGTSSGGGGSDVVTFTFEWDSSYSIVTSSCNKTFSECYNIVNEGDATALVSSTWDIDLDPWTSKSSATAVDYSDTYIKFVAFSGVVPWADITYHSDGQIDFSEPSAYSSNLVATSNGYYGMGNGGVYIDATVSVPSTTISPLSVTANGTYTAPSGTAYSPVTVNVSGGGGGSSSWNKVAERTYQISNYTDTSGANLYTWDTGYSGIWTSNKILYIRIRDTEGLRAGYFYGTDAFYLNFTAKNGTASSGTATGLIMSIWSVNSNGEYTQRYGYNTTGYGIYPNMVYSNGKIRIAGRYNSTYSRTINGTYSVEVYLLDPPTGAPIFT